MKLCVQCRYCKPNTTLTYRCDIYRKLCFEASQQGCGEWQGKEDALKGEDENEHRREGE